MKKSLIVAGITASAVFAISCGALLINGQPIKIASGESERVITFKNSTDVVSSGGSTFYLSATEFRRDSYMNFKSTGDELGAVKQFGKFQINCRETNSVAVFAKITRIVINYLIIGDMTDHAAVHIGDGVTGNFESNVKKTYYLNGTNNRYENKYIYLYDQESENSIVAFEAVKYFDWNIKSISVTYTC